MWKVFTLVLVLMFSGCAKREMTATDATIAAHQSATATACYNALAASKPNLSALSADQLLNYELAQGLRDANKLLAKVSLDPCAGAGGTNVYDAEKAVAHENTEQAKSFFGFGESLASKGLYAFIAYEAFGFLEGAGSTKLTLNGDSNSLDGVANKGNAWSQVQNPFTDNSVSTVTELLP